MRLRLALAAAALAAVLGGVMGIDYSICQFLTPGTYWYSFFMCDGAAGGGDSGAG